MKANLKTLKKQRDYSEKFKRQIVEDFESGRFTLRQLEKLHGVGLEMVYGLYIYAICYLALTSAFHNQPLAKK